MRFVAQKKVSVWLRMVDVPVVLPLPQGNAGIHESARQPAKHLRGQKCPIQRGKENTRGWGVLTDVGK